MRRENHDAPAASGPADCAEAYAAGGLGELERAWEAQAPSEASIAAIAEAALAAGDLAALSFLAEKAGGMAALEALAPGLALSALLAGDEETAVWLVSRGFWAKRPTRSRDLPKRADLAVKVPDNDLSIPVALGAVALLALLAKRCEWAREEIARADERGRTLLWDAKDAPSAALLLGMGLDPKAADRGGESPARALLREAAESEGPDRESRSQAAAEMIRATRGANPSALAAQIEAALPFPKALEALREAGADFAAPLAPPSYDPPAARAAQLGYADSAEALVRLGADPRAPNRDGESAIDILASRGQGAAAERILQAEAEREARERREARSRASDAERAAENR